ncbi:MAG: STAS domain-containing protein [Phycisphaerales bacterium]|nr:STAS domain-containing protein [Phycisphaerales bacterium]
MAQSTATQAPVVRPAGTITALNADEFRAALQEQLADGAKDLTIDLSDVDLIDSRGLAVFVVCHQTLLARGGTLTVLGADANLKGLFRVIRLDEHFRVLD